jgi:uncharacterized protein with PIN domain
LPSAPVTELYAGIQGRREPRRSAGRRTRVIRRLERAAARDFGRGGGHLAGLNFGDCFACALAKATGELLLFKGDEFAQTDVAAHL